MKTKNMFWAALSMTAALVMTACSNSDNEMTEAPIVPSTPTTITIPYTVTVNDGSSTRATVDADNRTLRFATGDKLYITGTDIQGILDLKDGDEGKTSEATFSGDLTYTGSGSPADDLELTATLVSAQQTVGTQVSVDGAGAVTVNYPTSAYCTSINDAVQQYSNLTGTSTYDAGTFTLTQQTAFLNFVITFNDGTTSGTEFSAVVSNNGSAICTANVTTTTESANVVAKFVLPVASGTVLSNATVKMGTNNALAISNATLTGKVYNVRKSLPITYYWYLGTTKPTDDAFIESNGTISQNSITSININDNDNYQYFAWPKEWGEPTLIDTANNGEFTISNVASLKSAFDENSNSIYNCRRVSKNTGDITCNITWIK